MTRPRRFRNQCRNKRPLALLLLACLPRCECGIEQLAELEALVKRDTVCALPGCPMDLRRFEPLVRRAMSRGYVTDWMGKYVLNGFIYGFDLGVRREMLHGTRVFSNYPTARNARASVTQAISSRVARHKSVCIGPWDDVKDALRSHFGDFFVYPMGAVPKPHQPDVMRPTSDHTRTGLNAATILGILGHSLDTYKKLEFLLTRNAWMTVADVDDAFSYIPLTPWLWAYMIFRWYSCGREASSEPEDSLSDALFVYVNLFADFGTCGAPGTFKVILVDVFVGVAQSEFVVSIPILVYVDDVALIAKNDEADAAAAECLANSEMTAFMQFTSEFCGLGWKTLKLLLAAQIQLYIGFWWNTKRFTRSLPEIKVASYLEVLASAALAPTLTLRARQSLAGKMQRVIMTLPPGAACLLVNCYVLMSGLSMPWQQRRTTRAEREDYSFVHDLLKYNQGRGYYSYAGFPQGAGFRSDASKSRSYTGGGWVVQTGLYDSFRYGSSTSRNLIDTLEGDVALRCCGLLPLGCLLWFARVGAAAGARRRRTRRPHCGLGPVAGR